MMESDFINATIDRGQHTVLVVDDNAATRYATSRVLRASGFQTAEASSGGESLARAAQGVSAVVLDVHLPDMNGFEVCRALRADPFTATLPVVHLSAEFTRDEDKVTGLDSGADAYLVHPVEPAVLVATLQALVRAQVGGIAALGGAIQGKGMIPKTRSGKTLRRVLRELVENAVHGDFAKEVQVPSTVEDIAVVEVAREKIREYFEAMGHRHKSVEARAKL